MIIVFLANPLSFFFLHGVADYVGGRPALLGMGLPGAEYANIDPKTRCLRTSGGCRVHGNEWVNMAPHNLALNALVFFLGPPADTYDGPYPTREEAMAASASGTFVSPEDSMSGVIRMNGREIRIEASVAEKIGRYFFPFGDYAVGELIEGEQLHAVLWKDRCLILRWRGVPEPDAARDDVVVLIDLRNGRPFAVYVIEGRPFIRRAAIGMFWK